MSAKCFLDTNILVYAHDRSAGEKHRRSLELVESIWNSGNGVISTQVLQEFCVTIRHKSERPLSLDDTFRILKQYLAWTVVVNSPVAVLHALEIEARYKIRFWDALILHAAEQGGAEILYSEDFSHEQRYGRVRVMNPLRSP